MLQAVEVGKTAAQRVGCQSAPCEHPFSCPRPSESLEYGPCFHCEQSDPVGFGSC